MTDVASNDLAPTVVAARGEQTSVPASRGVNQLGYRGWSDELTPGWLRWRVITEVGVRRAWQSRWLRRMLMFAWIPALWFGFGVFAWEQSATQVEWRPVLIWILGNLPDSPELNGIASAIQSGNLAETRHAVWGWLLQTFFRYPQGVIMVMVLGVISPPLISQDIRSRAFLIYFSRPLTRIEYLFGKLAIVWGYLSVISTAPALALYLLGILLSTELDVVSATWDLPLRILAASVALMLPTSALALCFSSLTQESRYAGFAWFAIWILGWFTYVAVTAAETFNAGQQVAQQHRARGPFSRRVFAGQKPTVEIQESAWTHLSLYHTLGRVQSWIFGFSKFNDVIVSMGILIVVTLVSLRIVYQRISAPMRV